MKKINLIICFLILIGFTFIYKPINVSAAYQTRFFWDIDGYVNDEKIFSNYYNLNNYKIVNRDIPVIGKVDFKIFGDIYDDVVENPVGLSLNVSITTCSTGVGLNVVDGSTVSGHFLFTGILSNKQIGSCSISGYGGALYEVQFSVYVHNSSYNVDGDYWYSLGFINVLSGIPTTYNTFFRFVSINVETANIENKIIIDQQEQIIEDTRTIWQKIADLPSDLWNLLKNLPSNLWNLLKDLPSLTWDFFKHLPSSIFGVFSPAMNALSDVGGFILDSINNLYQNDEIDIDLSDLSNVGGWLPPGPVDSILNLPFNFLNNLNNNLSKECTPVNIPLPYVNKNLPLPCVNSLYDSIPGLNVWISSTSIIIAGIIGFKYLINLYKWVDDTLSFRENNHLDNWGGL